MAAKKSTKVNFMSGKQCEVCGCTCNGKWATFGWGVLLVGGLGHMLPAQMAPVLNWSLWGVSVQMAVGVLSVVFALYFLLGNE